MNTVISANAVRPQTESLLARIKNYSFPGGEDMGRSVRCIKTTQRGEIRSGPEARWVAFTAEEYVDAMKSGFCCDATLGSGLTAVHVTDAYENGHGRLIVRKGPLQLKKLVGVDVDKGELQRYLAYMIYCPPMLVNNASLEFTAVSPRVLRLRDRADSTNTSVDIEVEDTGCITVAHAVRPMIVGKRILWTPWSARGSDIEERGGLRVPRTLEASWDLPEGVFTYIRIELLNFELVH
jgi:hypothetical protein